MKTCRPLPAALLIAGGMLLASLASAQAQDARLPPALYGATRSAASPGWTEARSFSSLDAMYRHCRRQVRRAAGIIPGKRMRLPRAYSQFVDRCVANGGVYG
jgi:hypothetical protein